MTYHTPTPAQIEILAKAMEQTAADAGDLAGVRTELMLRALTELAAKGFNGQTAVVAAAEIADLAEDFVRQSAQKAVARSRSKQNAEIPAAVMAEVLKASGPAFVDTTISQMATSIKYKRANMSEKSLGIIRQ